LSTDWGVKPRLKPHVPSSLRAAEAALWYGAAGIFPKAIEAVSYTRRG